MHWRPDVWSLALFLGLVVGVGGTAPVQAQNNQLTQRSFVATPAVLGMGDAGVALPGPDQVFFYNPAHLPSTASSFTILGLQGGATRSLDDHVRFLNDAVPLVRDGVGAPSPVDLAVLDRAAAPLHRRPGRGTGGILLPSFVYSPGALGIGGGLFTKTAVNYRLQPGAETLPDAWLLSRTDLMATVSVGLDLRVVGLSGVSVGITGTRARRLLAFKQEGVSMLTDGEPTVRIQGETTQVDAGAVYRPGWARRLPGTLRLAGAVYDVLPDGYDYTLGGTGRLPFLEEAITQPSTDSLPLSPQTFNRVRDQFRLEPSYRVGAAYELSSVALFDEVGLAVDYQGYGRVRAPSISRLHAGARARVGVLRFRAGLNGGYPTGGLGVEVGALAVDYSLHGTESGDGGDRFPAYVHTARLLVRLD